MGRLLVRASMAGLATLAMAVPASAAIYHFDVNLDPYQEVPPHNTPGYGSVDLTLDSSSGLLSVDAGTGVYADLLGNSSTVRVQDAAVGANGPTQFLLNLDNPGTTSGTFSGSGNLSSGAITDLLAGDLYINITDNVYPSGEIRGQIDFVPEPASLGLIAAAGLFIMRRRKVKGEG